MMNIPHITDTRVAVLDFGIILEGLWKQRCDLEKRAHDEARCGSGQQNLTWNIRQPQSWYVLFPVKYHI